MNWSLLYVNCVIKEQFLQLRYYRKITMNAFLKLHVKKIGATICQTMIHPNLCYKL